MIGNLTVEYLKKDNYQAYARNRLIAETFYLTGDIEKYGTGFTRIRKAISEYPTMKIDFGEIPNGFLVTYSYIEQKTDTAEQKSTPKSCIENENYPENIKSSEKILFAIEKNAYTTIFELSELTNLTTRAIEKTIAKLKSKGVIERVGTDKGGYWRIINHEEEE